MTYLFIDTNVFLHFAFFDEIPWSKIVGDQCRLLVAPVVLDELDKHKRNHHAKIASRAKNVLSKMHQVHGGSYQYPMEILLKRPSQQTLEQFHLDSREQDDLLLATIKEYIKVNEGQKVLLVSYDTGPLLRASSLSISTLKMEEEYQLPREKSEEQKEIESLRKELVALKNAQPKLMLTFEGKQLLFERTIDRLPESEEQQTDKEMKSKVDSIPPLVYSDPKNVQEQLEKIQDPLQRAALQMAHLTELGALTKEQIDQYNNELKEYKEEFDKYLERKAFMKEIRAYSIPIKLELHNTGTAPATDIDLWLHFPDGTMIIYPENLPEDPEMPQPPYRPKHRFDVGLVSHFGTVPSFISKDAASQLSLNKPQIRKTNSYEVDIHFASLKHHQLEKIEPLLAVFPSYESIFSFSIEYKIIVGNLHKPVEGTLHLKLG